jgi:hypothetical protein
MQPSTWRRQVGFWMLVVCVFVCLCVAFLLLFGLGRAGLGWGAWQEGRVARPLPPRSGLHRFSAHPGFGPPSVCVPQSRSGWWWRRSSRRAPRRSRASWRLVGGMRAGCVLGEDCNTHRRPPWTHVLVRLAAHQASTAGPAAPQRHPPPSSIRPPKPSRRGRARAGGRGPARRRWPPRARVGAVAARGPAAAERDEQHGGHCSGVAGARGAASVSWRGR